MSIDRKIKETRRLAEIALQPQLEMTDRLGLDQTGPYSMLRSYPWERHIKVNDNLGTVSDVANLNRNFDLRGCFGRTVLALCLVERYFPQMADRVTVAEVVEDQLCKMVLRKMSLLPEENEENYNSRHEMAWEVLMYEDPHMVLLLNLPGGLVQFDPLSKVCGFEVCHPKVSAVNNPWAAITASLVVEEALLQEDMTARLIDLERAKVICPELILTLQVQVGTLQGLGQLAGNTALVKELVLRRPTARVLYGLGMDRSMVKYPWEVTEILMEQQLIEVFRLREAGYVK